MAAATTSEVLLFRDVIRLPPFLELVPLLIYDCCVVVGLVAWKLLLFGSLGMRAAVGLNTI